MTNDEKYEKELYKSEEPSFVENTKRRQEYVEIAKEEGLTNKDAKNFAALKMVMDKEKAKRIMRNL